MTVKKLRNVLLALLVVCALSAPAAMAAEPEGPDDVIVRVPDIGQGSDEEIPQVISNAQMRWGINSESGAGAFFGGCNFLSAGRSGDVGGTKVWTAADAERLYRSSEGNVHIEKPTSAGSWERATWSNKCLDSNGKAVVASSIDSASHNQVVIDKGQGTLDASGNLVITWHGSFTIVFYGGMTYWSATDPVLKLNAAGNGQLTATASGFGSDMADMTRWEKLPEREIVLAEIRGADVRGGQGGFSVVPEYLNVTAPAGMGQVAKNADNASYWGAFPKSFLEYQELTGQLGYWLTTGGGRDRAKVPTTLFVSYDAQAPITVTPPATPSESGTDPVNNSVFPPAPRTDSVVAAPIGGTAPPDVTLPTGGSPLTFTPEQAGLVPVALATSVSLSSALLLVVVLALQGGVIATLSMKGLLPWQQRTALA